jgi:hypothetical protein
MKIKKHAVPLVHCKPEYPGKTPAIETRSRLLWLLLIPLTTVALTALCVTLPTLLYFNLVSNEDLMA